MTDILKIREQFARSALANYYVTRPRDDDELHIAAALASAALRIFVAEVMESIASATHHECKKIALEKAMELFDQVTSEHAPSEKIHIHFKNLRTKLCQDISKLETSLKKIRTNLSGSLAQ